MYNNSRHIGAQMKRNLYYRLQYKAVSRDIRDKMGLEIKEKSNIQSQAILSDRLIIVNSNLSDEHKLYTLLHEAGHFLIWRSKGHGKIYREGYKLYKRLDKSYGFRILTLGEEILSWDYGLKYGKGIPIRINRFRYERYKGRMLRGYMKWVLDKDRSKWRDHCE